MNYIAWQNAFMSTAFSAHGTIAVLYGNCKSVNCMHTKHGGTTSHITLYMNHLSSFNV
jgi:hypothetical protein